MSECLLRRFGSAVVCCRAGALGAADLGVAEALLEEVALNPAIELPALT